MLENESESMIDTYKREIKACESIIMVQLDNEENFNSGIKKLKEEQKAAHPEKDLVGLFEKRLDELEKKTDGTQTLVEEMKNQKKYSNLTTRAQKLCWDRQFDAKRIIFLEFCKILRDEKVKVIDEERQHDLRRSNIMVFGRNKKHRSLR